MSASGAKSTAESRRRDSLREMNSSLGDIYNEKMELEKRLEYLGEQEEKILKNRKQITDLHLAKSGEDLLAEKREIVFSDLIKACSKHARMRFEGNKIRYSIAAVSPQVKKALQECYEYNITHKYENNTIHEFMSAVLFIFGLAGSEIDLSNIKNLDPENPEDRDMIERIMVYLNDETDFAIDTCMKMTPGKYKSELFYGRIQKIEKAMIDFKKPKKNTTNTLQMLKTK